MYNPNLVCKEGDMFCYMKHPSEFNAWVVGAYFFLENYSLPELKYIMSTKQDIEQKKIDILNRVYLKILKDKSFKAELMKQDLLH